MDDKDRWILNEFAARLRQRYIDARIWAYGSRAKGTADWDSDFDICIVLDEVRPEGSDSFGILPGNSDSKMIELLRPLLLTKKDLNMAPCRKVRWLPISSVKVSPHDKQKCFAWVNFQSTVRG